MTRKTYWVTVMFADTTIAELAKDGLLYRFNSIDVIKWLSQNFISDKGGWYFNATKDRYCAEWSGKDKIVINPSIVAFRFGTYVLRED